MPHRKPVTIQDTFERILLTMDEVAKYDDRNEDIDKMISNAKELGQSTLVNQLIEKKPQSLLRTSYSRWTVASF